MSAMSEHPPNPVAQVMVSSTFTDLQEHRAALIQALNEHDLHPKVMEYGSQMLKDVIAASLDMVRASAAYIGLISLKYGQTPECPTHNPDGLSITELEFNEAQRLGRPILLFIMGRKHPVTIDDIETDPDKLAKLNAFRERAKQSSPDSKVHRIYREFNSLAEFKEKMAAPLAELQHALPDPNWVRSDPATPPPVVATANPDIPKPPAFYAAPDYIGSHDFIGRAAQLQDLQDWAKPADPTNLLLFEAIGGNGKSLLTWEWARNRAGGERDWAGRFWYSFYERGAVMADFCQRALAYMTGAPLAELRKHKTAELKERLLAELHARPWLLVLDGLERVLVAYHRLDAAEVPDEAADQPTDAIVDRNPCDAIRDEDNDLLRALAAAAPSKILASSRLTPRVWLNASGQAIAGIRRIALPGLRPADAEQLLRACGVNGDSAAIQAYLTQNCDNHPLAIGVLAGLINDYLPDRGNFDAWAKDPDGGGRLDLASLELKQRRNHILRAALAALPPPGAQLLGTLALLSEAVDYAVLGAFNPHVPPEPEAVEQPQAPEQHWDWKWLSDDEKAGRRQHYEDGLARWQAYQQALQAWRESPDYRAAPKKLEGTVRDLERRGLLQYDRRDQRYDLHPVVRAVAAGWMADADKQRHGQRVVDYFSAQPHNPYEQAETLDDLRAGLHVVRTLLKLGRRQAAADAYRSDLSRALLFNLEAYSEALALLRPFFAAGWGALPDGVAAAGGSYLANDAAGVLFYLGEAQPALAAYGAGLQADLEGEAWGNVRVKLSNIALSLSSQSRLAAAGRVYRHAFDLSSVRDERQDVFISLLLLFDHYASIGQWPEAAAAWQRLGPMGRDWPRAAYRPGDAEYYFARYQFWQGTLQDAQLASAERLAGQGKNRTVIRLLHWLRGAWRLGQGDWPAAAASLQEAVRLARASGIADTVSETALALAKFQLGQLVEPQQEAERLAQLRDPAQRYLAELWLALGDHEQARQHALAAYEWAWADGEPYVFRYALTQSTELLQRLAVPPPQLPPYDPAKDEKFPWEDAVVAAIAKLRQK